MPVPRSGSSRRGWLAASYAEAAAFFALEAVAREPGEASGLAATESDQGTTRQLAAAYGLAAGLSPVLRRLRAGRLAARVRPAGVAMMTAGLALRAWSMRTLGAYYSRTLRTTSDQGVVEYGPYRVIRHPGYLGVGHGLDRLRGDVRERGRGSGSGGLDGQCLQPADRR